jgi:hypothetical protein
MRTTKKDFQQNQGYNNIFKLPNYILIMNLLQVLFDADNERRIKKLSREFPTIQIGQIRKDYNNARIYGDIGQRDLPAYLSRIYSLANNSIEIRLARTKRFLRESF